MGCDDNIDFKSYRSLEFRVGVHTTTTVDIGVVDHPVPGGRLGPRCCAVYPRAQQEEDPTKSRK